MVGRGEGTWKIPQGGNQTGSIESHFSGMHEGGFLFFRLIFSMFYLARHTILGKAAFLRG
jgi:hypothetical protein